MYCLKNNFMRKNLAFYFRLNPAIPYPSEEVRTNIMRPYKNNSEEM
jgi:hypothetical protein